MNKKMTRLALGGKWGGRGESGSIADFAAAAAKFPLFAAVGDATTQKREVAAFLGNVSLETNDLQFTDEVNQATTPYCMSSAQYPCADGQSYHGRGPLQISWNYNYGAAATVLGEPLLANPSLVSSNGKVAWETAIWFWMTITAGGRTAHTVMVQNAGFGLTINVINGSVECNGKRPDAVNKRVAPSKSSAAYSASTPARTSPANPIESP